MLWFSLSRSLMLLISFFLNLFSLSLPLAPCPSLWLLLSLSSLLPCPSLPWSVSPEGWDWRRSLLWTRDKHASLGRNHKTVPGPGEERKQVRMMLGNVGSPNILCTWVSYWGYSWIFLDTIVLVTAGEVSHPVWWWKPPQEEKMHLITLWFLTNNIPLVGIVLNLELRLLCSVGSENGRLSGRQLVLVVEFLNRNICLSAHIAMAWLPWHIMSNHLRHDISIYQYMWHP